MAEPSNADFAIDSVDGVIRLLSRWIANSPDGWASVVFRSYFTAEKAIQQLQSAHGAEAMPVVDPGINDEALSTLLRQIDAAKPDQTLLLKLGPQSEEFFGLLNLHRENIRHHPGVRIVFWMGHEAYRRLLHAARDFESWIQLRLRLEELPAPLPILEKREPLVPASVEEWTAEERARVEEATQRIQKARAAGIDEQEIWRDILAPTLDWLAEQGVKQSSIRWFVEMRVPAPTVPLLLEETDRLVRWGELQLAERLLVEEGLPLCPAPGRETDFIQVQDRLADIVEIRGELDEALRIRTDQVLPIATRLGLERPIAVLNAKVAAVLYKQGKLNESLHLLHQCLSKFEKLGAEQDLAMTQVKVAEILILQGNFDEASRILANSAVVAALNPRQQAILHHQMAHQLMRRGDLDGAITRLREVALPAMSKLGDRLEIVHGEANLGGMLLERANSGDVEEARRLLVHAFTEAQAMKVPLADTLKVRYPFLLAATPRSS